MSAISGIYSAELNEDPAWVLDRMAPTLERLGPDGMARRQSGPVTMTFQAFHNLAEDGCHQPVLAPDGVLLAWDGRLDNREDVCADLGWSHKGDTADVELVLAVYRKHGLDFLRHLVGDFACSLWDPGEDVLLLARDPFGVRTLYYRMGENQVVWASSLGAVLDSARESFQVDEDYVASYLTGSRTRDSTPYRAVRRVPPAHYVLVKPNGMKSSAYWRPPLDTTLSYDSDREYEEHFQEVFQTAVACRIRGNSPVVCELSGGLDSSSIVLVADELMRRGESSAPAVATLSYVFDDAPTSDERNYIELVEDRRGARGIHLSERDHPILRPLEGVDLEFPTPEEIFATRQQAVHDALEGLSARALLRGIGGDHLLWSEAPYPYELADYLSRGKIGSLVAALGEWSRRDGPPLVQLLWHGGVVPLLPRRLEAAMTRSEQRLDVIHPEFRARMKLYEKARADPGNGRRGLPSRRLQHGWLGGLDTSVGWGFFVPRGFVEPRYPFLDRRVVEFCLSLPLRQLFRPGETRSLLRRALRHLLPPEIAQRVSKSGPHEAILRAIHREWRWIRSMFEDALVYEHGYTDRNRFLKTLETARHGRAENSPLLIRMITLEWWLRSSVSRNRLA